MQKRRIKKKDVGTYFEKIEGRTCLGLRFFKLLAISFIGHPCLSSQHLSVYK